MLTSKQRAYLRSLANPLDTILMVGKSGLSPELVKQADDALTARELIKGRALETAPLSPRDAAEELARETGAEVVQVIGTRFVLYRRHPKEPRNLEQDFLLIRRFPLSRCMDDRSVGSLPDSGSCILQYFQQPSFL